MKWSLPASILRGLSGLMVLLFVTVGLPAAGGSGARAQSATTAPISLDPATSSRILENVSGLLAAHYVDSLQALKTGAFLKRSVKEGRYAGLADPVAFADSVTGDLTRFCHDRHLRLRYNPQFATMLADTGGTTEKGTEEERLRARRGNFGFRKVEILPGNIGYLDFRRFAPPQWAAETAIGAMSFLAGCDAVIIDLRENGGGEPSMVQLLCSYFFPAGEPVHLNSLYFREGHRTDQFWTLPYVPGTRLATQPVFVLTSHQTFSGAEEFAYNLQTRKRATLIGETTGGGANPGSAFPAGSGFVVFVPAGKAVNPVTGTNWEGTGVVPDISTSADAALDTARAEALKRLIASSTDEQRKKELTWMAEEAEAEVHPITLPADAGQTYVGVYGIRRVTLEDGRLYFQRERLPRRLMVPLATDAFLLEGMDGFRLYFTRNPDGSVASMRGEYLDQPGWTERKGGSS